MPILSRGSNELAQRCTWICLSCSSRSRTPAALIVAHERSSPQRHQRNYSSSKTSSSPKEYPRTITTPSEPTSKSVTRDTRDKVEDVLEGSDKRSNGRAGKQKMKESARNLSTKAEYTAEMNLPYVPSTQNLHPLSEYHEI